MESQGPSIGQENEAPKLVLTGSNSCPLHIAPLSHMSLCSHQVHSSEVCVPDTWALSSDHLLSEISLLLKFLLPPKVVVYFVPKAG